MVQTNFGRRDQLTIVGTPIGHELADYAPYSKRPSPFAQDIGSLIVIIGTDAPLLPHQLKRVAKRAALGMARTGSFGGNGSGDIFLAFSTANPKAAYPDKNGLSDLQSLSNEHIDPILFASVYATEEAIINAMVAAEDMVGHNGVHIKALPHDKVREVLKQYNRLAS